MKKTLTALCIFLAVFASQAISDTPLDGAEFVFARVQYYMPLNARFGMYREAPWHHDYPFSEELYLTVLSEISTVKTNINAYQIVQLDSPEIFKYPFLYVSEPGFMDLTDEETVNLREHFNRGGFVMFDDFRGFDLRNLQVQMKKVFPDRDMRRLDLSHPVFNTYFEINTLDMTPPYMNSDSGTPEFWGMSDETGRLILVANHNNDFGEFWEYIERGETPFKMGAQAFKFGVNYLIYAMTH